MSGKGHLIIERKIGESILIGDDIRITVVARRGAARVSLSIEAPRNVSIDREEIRNDPNYNPHRIVRDSTDK